MTVKSKIIFTTISLFAVAGISATVFFGCSSNNLNIQTTTATTIPTTLAALELEYKDGKKVVEIEEGGAVKAADLPIECEGAGKLAIVFSDNTAKKTFEKSGDYEVTAEVTDLSTGRTGTIAFTVRVSAPHTTTAPTTTAKATQAATSAPKVTKAQSATKKSSSGSNSGTKAQSTTKKSSSSSGSSSKPKTTTKKSTSSGSSGSSSSKTSDKKKQAAENAAKIAKELNEEYEKNGTFGAGVGF